MRTIWKYELPAPDTSLSIPDPALFRHFDAQHGVLCAWFEVDTEAEKHYHRFLCVNSGAEIPRDGAYRGVYQGTANLAGIVWHLYEGVPHEKDKRVMVCDCIDSEPHVHTRDLSISGGEGA